jgi:hypothetical protein
MVKVQRGGGERKGQGDGKLVFKARDERFGNLVSKPDEVTAGHYVPWARKQKPGSVKEITFNDDSRRFVVKLFVSLLLGPPWGTR